MREEDRQISIEKIESVQNVGIEDEYHVLIECPRYREKRKGCLSHALKTKPSMFEFVKYIKCVNEADCNKIGRLCSRVQTEY